MRRNFIDFIPKWSTLRGLGNSRTIRSSYVWLLVVPIAANSLSKIQSPTAFYVFNSELLINMGLPFSWKVFFFAACFFALASLIYRAKCPPTIRKYSNYSEFREQGGSYRELHREIGISILKLKKDLTHVDIFHAAKSSYAIIVGPPDHEERFSDELGKPSTLEGPDRLMRIVQETPPSDRTFPDVFWHCQNGADKRYPFTRAVLAALYAIGIGLSFVIAIQNIIFVIDYI